MWRYIQKTGGLLDAAVEPPRARLVLSSPDLLFFALFGYFFPLGDNMVVSFRTSPMGTPGKKEGEHAISS
jgi:hypothetical protein